MKDKVNAIHTDLSDYNSFGFVSAGTIWFFRDDKNDKTKSRVSSHPRINIPRRVARALEAQRLFLAQLDKKYKGLAK